VKLRTVILVAAACVLAASCDSAAFLSATVTLPEKLNYRQIAIDQHDLLSELNLSSPGTEIGRSQNWRIDGHIPDWDKGFMCGEPKVICSGERQFLLDGDKLRIAYWSLKSQFIQFRSDGESVEYYYSAVPGRVGRGTESIILELGRLTAKKYKKLSFKVCRGDAGDECHEERVGK
jgi:hypothetical protein